MLRRRPRQSRARASARALQESFVQVLLERGYRGITVREVALVAGVSVGTFYEYFGDLRALAAVSIAVNVKALERELRGVAARARGEPPLAVVAAMSGAMSARVLGAPVRWRALLQLEREVSTPAAYRRQYAYWVDLWREALDMAVPQPHSAALAHMVHAITYGWLSQCLLTLEPPLDTAALQAQLHTALFGYLERAGTAG